MQYYVYILTTVNNTALYIGVTNDLRRRTIEHKSEIHDGFSKRYKTCKLVYYECTGDVKAAIAREKQLKGWRREKKLKLIESFNPEWDDLFMI
ncbi:MAG: GIY-YIG nuclease family protein [Clostridia bacterium]|nr:GIY-YIG nuclease family protein [Clostridia bacterium]